jgi:SAM-dependent methyltransferase
MSDWAREYFERGYTQRWGPPQVSDQVRREAGGLWDQLALTTHSNVVDVGCGYGRHALALALRGAEVVGIDTAVALLRQARGLGAGLGVQAHWVRGDVRRLPLGSAWFSAAILMDAFGFFEAEEENEAVLAEIVRVLAPGGRVGLKVVNGATILANFRGADREERDGTLVTLSRTLAMEPPRVRERIVVSGPGGTGEYERRQRLYTAEELCAALERAGLSVEGVFSSAQRAAFEPAASPTMWVIGRRRAVASGMVMRRRPRR